MNLDGGSPISKRDAAIVIIALGSIWGFLEVVVGGTMRSASIPYKGDLLTGLGIGLMAVLLALRRTPAALLAIAFLAVAVKQLAVPILDLPFMCKANSCLAVALAGGALAGISAIAGGRLARRLSARVATGVSAGLAGSAGFYAIGMRLAPCNYLLSFDRPGGFVAFMLAEGLIWAALGGLFFPAGYGLGVRLKTGIYGLPARRPRLYYGGLAAIIASAWIASGIAIRAGL